MNQLKNNAIFLLLTCTFMTSGGAAPQDGYDRYWIDSYGNFVRDDFGNCIKSINWTAEFDEQSYAPGCDPEPQVAEKDKGAKEIVSAKFEPAPAIETISLDAHTLFAFNSSKLTDHSKEAIHALTDKLKSFEKVDEIEIAGYADTTGPEGYNQRLSERRAEAIKQKLISKYGIDPDIITTRGYGESSPVASNATVEGRRLNRRAEIKIMAKRKIVE
jgi:OOP family OmpA-OmpF porin